jgi:hypothetical protein
LVGKLSVIGYRSQATGYRGQELRNSSCSLSSCHVYDQEPV